MCERVLYMSKKHVGNKLAKVTAVMVEDDAPVVLLIHMIALTVDDQKESVQLMCLHCGYSP